MLYYIAINAHADKNWYHFIKEYLEKISKFAFQEVALPVGWSNRHISEFYFPLDTLWLCKTMGWMLGYTTEETWWLLLDFSWFLPPTE